MAVVPGLELQACRAGQSWPDGTTCHGPGLEHPRLHRPPLLYHHHAPFPCQFPHLLKRASRMRCIERMGLGGVNHQLPWLMVLLREGLPAWPGMAVQTLGIALGSVMGQGPPQCHRGEEERLWKAPCPPALSVSPNSMIGMAERWRT